MQVVNIIVTSLEKFENNSKYKTTKRTFFQGFRPENYSMSGWEIPSKDNDFKYVHHYHVRDAGVSKYYIDGCRISLTDKRAVLGELIPA